MCVVSTSTPTRSGATIACQTSMVLEVFPFGGFPSPPSRSRATPAYQISVVPGVLAPVRHSPLPTIRGDHGLSNIDGARWPCPCAAFPPPLALWRDLALPNIVGVGGSCPCVVFPPPSPTRSGATAAYQTSLVPGGLARLRRPLPPSRSGATTAYERWCRGPLHSCGFPPCLPSTQVRLRPTNCRWCQSVLPLCGAPSLALRRDHGVSNINGVGGFRPIAAFLPLPATRSGATTVYQISMTLGGVGLVRRSLPPPRAHARPVVHGLSNIDGAGGSCPGTAFSSAPHALRRDHGL